MKRQIVTTREELEQAQKIGVEEIILKGELANKFKKAKTITKLGTAGLGALTAVLGAGAVLAPVTGGISAGVVGPVAVITGLEIAAIISALSLGIALVLAIFKGYEEISFRPGELRLRKKSAR